jgi:anaerobic selenocysteine-containing dehydrogenase
MDAMADGKMRAGWCLGGNLFGATPDSEWARSAFNRLDSLVYLSTTLNTGHVHGRGKATMILPVLARDEEPQPTTQESMFNFVRLSDGGPARHEGPRSEVAVIAEAAGRVLGAGGPIDWSAIARHQAIRQAIAAVVPGYEKIAAIGETRQEFQIEGRTMHARTFPTPTGRAAFRVTPIPQLDRAGAALRLMTLRSEGQFNTVVYEEADLYRHQERRDVILMNRDDIARLGLRVDQRVTVRRGERSMPGILVRAFDIRTGNAAMYFPEANTLVPRDAGPESRTPGVQVCPRDHRSQVVTDRRPQRRTRLPLAGRRRYSARERTDSLRLVWCGARSRRSNCR